MSSDTLTKADLTSEVADLAGLSKTQSKAAVDAFAQVIADNLSAGKRVQLTGFGTFEVRKRQAREGVKPGTSEKIQIPASKVPAFKPGKALKDRLRD